METIEMNSLNQKIAILKRVAKLRLGEEGVWGLRKDTQIFTHEEILFLFARVFPVYEIDYIKQIRTNFPDCVCMKEGKEIGIEFEPLLSTFRDHLTRNDDLTKCQYIVCWKDDLERDSSIREEIEKHKVNVIELEELYKKTKGKKQPPPPFGWTPEVIELLRPNQLKVLNAFISLNKEILNQKEIGNFLNMDNKDRVSLGGMVKGFTEKAKKKDWLLKKHTLGWKFNKKYRQQVLTALKRIGVDIGIVPR